MKKLAFLLGLATIAAAANAVIFETESNNSVASANLISRPAGPFSELVLANLGSADVDYFTVNLVAGEVLTLITTPLDVIFTSPDTIMQLLDPTLSQVAFNDDAGGGFGSAIRHEALMTGTYVVTVSGFGDSDFDGVGHAESGNYALTASVVPEPATMVALGLGVATLLRRRNKK